ncbi:hypothetical protein RHSIM_Rhsim05G0173200 [Rhododendron simsii]|uniref:Uncharacterized protein n=1 Tax=Rhododendron simsii TaxID=118357 RepID=A0A834GXF3_RHOSS|nr:hypothetical protein RHSIM_Rhsim05G0173200 [Rhododendron simsii]
MDRSWYSRVNCFLSTNQVGSSPHRDILPEHVVTFISTPSFATFSFVFNSTIQGTNTSKSLGVAKYQHSDSTQPASSTHGGSSVLRPLPNYNRQSQQVIGLKKVLVRNGTKASEPKSHSRIWNIDGSTEVPTTAETTIQSNPVLSVLDSKEATSKLQRKLMCGTFLIVMLVKLLLWNT